MSDMLERELRSALAADADPALAEALDWDDVLARAGRTAARRQRLRRAGGGLAIALVLTGAALAAPQLGQRLLAGSGDDRTPLPRVDRQLRKLRPGPRFASRVVPKLVPGSTRAVMSIPLAGGHRAWLYVARTRAGGVCFVTTGRPFGRGGCHLGPRLAPIWARWGEFEARDAHGRLRSSFSVVGRVADRRASVVRIAYRDGARQLVRPVVDGWFMAVIPRRHARPAAAPVALAAIGSGRVRAVQPFSVSFGPGRPPSHAPPVPPPPGFRAAVPPLLAPSSGRTVAVLHLAGGRLARLQVGRHAGRTCWRVVVGIRSMFTCSRGRHADIEVDATHAYDGTRYGFLAGWAGKRARALVVDYQDGRRQPLPLHGGFFLVPLASSRWRSGARPATLVVLGASGRVLERRSLHPAAHCRYPVRDPVCGLGRPWWEPQRSIHP
jgi:hypothetical protein